MTDDEARALGERWIKAGGGWRLWMRGVDPDGEAWRIGNDGETIREHGLEVRYSGLLRPCLRPDLRDPATRGAALDVVRKRLGAPGAYVFHASGGWMVYTPAGRWGHDSADAVGERDSLVPWPSEAEALVAALEAAPKSPEAP